MALKHGDIDLKKASQIVFYTVLFDALIAVLITTLGYGNGIKTNMIMSQCIGLSNAMLILVALSLINPVHRIKKAFLLFLSLIVGSTLGILTGRVVSGFKNLSVSETVFFIQALFISLIFGLVISNFFGSRHRLTLSQQMIDDERIKRLSSEKLAVMAELKMLQTQIEPHFLYNTLFNIRSLMDLDVNQAKQMLEHLSDFLRLTLSSSRKETTRLDDEITLIKAYLNIYTCRMHERLSYSIDVDPQILSSPVPPMLLQPLVENAIKHGLEPHIDGGTITIVGTKCKNILRLEVHDTGMGFDDFKSGGVGLVNIRERLKGLFGDLGRLTLKNNSTSGVTAIIEIPHEQN